MLLFVRPGFARDKCGGNERDRCFHMNKGVPSGGKRERASGWGGAYRGASMSGVSGIRGWWAQGTIGMRVWTRAWLRVEQPGALSVRWLGEFESASLNHHRVSLHRVEKRVQKQYRQAGSKTIPPSGTRNGPVWRDQKWSRLARPKMVPPGETKNGPAWRDQIQFP